MPSTESVTPSSKDKNPKKREKEYVYIYDTLYDVTEFAKKHPGGSVLSTMLWKENDPKDASQHFREFHYRQSRQPNSRVKQMLNDLPKAPVEMQQKARESQKNKPLREQEMIRDFVKMRQELEKKGFFEPDYFWVALRLVYVASLWALGYYVVSFNCFWGIFILSWALEQAGWVHHEGGHRSLTGIVRVDGAIQQFVVCILFSASANFWNYQHNHHHANTQHEELDIDLKTLPLIAFDRAVLEAEDEAHKQKVSKPKSKNKNISFWVKHQWLTILVSNLLVYSLWRFFIHSRYELRKGRYYHFLISFGVCFLWHYGILMKFCQLNFFWATFVYAAYCSCGVWLLLVHFTVSHTFTGVHDGKYNWVETAAHYTVNVNDHWLVNLIMGLLNFQIEHHLFPQMSHQNARRAAPYVRELFKKYQLPYYAYGYWHGFSLVVKNLYHVGHDLPDVRPTVTNLSKTKSS